MMRLCPAPLSPEEARSLRELQAQIDAAPDHGARVSRALSQWNVAALGGARDKLMAARPRLERCVYCEDSLGKQLDHLRPRTTCPELTWAFTNLVVACDCCNGRSYKGSRDAILDANVPTGWREITPRRGARDRRTVFQSTGNQDSDCQIRRHRRGRRKAGSTIGKRAAYAS